MAIRVTRKREDAYQHGNLRQAMIQAGLKLLAEGGVEGLSLRAAAQLAGVSHAAPYRHFRDKDALVAAIAEEGFRLLTRRMREEIAALGAGAGAGARVDVLARLRAAARGYVSFAVEHPAYFRTVFSSHTCAGGPPASLVAAGDEAYHVLRDLAAEGIASGALRASDPDALSLAAWSQVHGLGMLIIDGQVPDLRGSADRAKVVALAEMVTDFLERGIVARSTSEP